MDVEETGEAAFLKVVSKSDAEQGGNAETKNEPPATEPRKPTFLALLPLSQKEIRQFGAAYAPELAKEFCKELEAHDLWHLYRLPAEIIEALDNMDQTGVLGSLQDQLKQGIQRKLSEKNLRMRNALSVEKAQEGAERIALALFLLKRRSIKTSLTGGSDGVDIGEILTDWNLKEQQELIAKPLFDPSGIGSVRFHHRASQEYLAAKRLEGLRSKGMPLGDRFALLFGEIAGQRVVKPGMAPVAAWLSLWDADIKREVVNREPQLLFRQGLPSAFPIEMRAEILRHYIRQYAGKDWCKTGVGHDQIERIAHPDLGPVIRELWGSAYSGHDSRELLLELIWMTPIPDCADLALSAARDANLDTNHRTYGARGVLAGGSTAQKAALARAVLGGSLPEDMVRYTLYDMVPELVAPQQFLLLVDGMKQDKNNIHGLSYTIYQTAKRGNLALSDVITIRDGLAAAVWESRRADSSMYSIRSEKDHYQDGLVAFCAGSIPPLGSELRTWAHSTVIAIQSGRRQETIIAKTEMRELRAALQARTDLREAYFRAGLELADALEAEKPDWWRADFATGGWQNLFSVGDEDLTWLLDAVASDISDSSRGVAFWVVARHFDLRARRDLQDNLRSRVADREDLTNELDRLLNPPPREKADWEIENEKRQMSHARKEQKRIAGWVKWRNEVLADPDFLMGGDRRLGVLYDAHKLIKQSNPKLDRWGHWDGEVIHRAMGSAFLERYRAELAKFWRETTCC
ncbi:MAG: hypothetical protein HC788_06805 [Sphingopyxis sp.]|nr:hypothetical protein [Sphingopyxis sp.]